MGKYPHLHPSVAAECIELSTDERINFLLTPRWVGYPRAKIINQNLEDLLSHPRVTRMPNMLVIGRTNNGKTDLVRRFCDRHPASENPGGENIFCPVLFAQVPPKPTESGLYSEILRPLLERVPPGSADDKRARLVSILRGIQLKVLVLDEMHNMLTGSSLSQHHFLNVVKYLTNELQISIVGVGDETLLRGVSIDPQVQNRFEPALLTKWVMGKEFRQLLMSFEMLLPLRNPSNLSDPMLSAKVLSMCEGTIGELSRLLNMATKYAILNKEEKIGVEALKRCGYVPPSGRKKVEGEI